VKRKARRNGDRRTQLIEALANTAKHIEGIQHAVNEVAEDNMALSGAVNRIGAGQESMRTLIVQEIDRVRSDLAGKLVADVSRRSCRELAPVVDALQRMLAEANFEDAETTRRHVASVVMTLEGAMRRMGIERLPIVEGRDLFDSRLHECVGICTEADSPHPDAPTRTIVRVEAAGYLVDGQLSVPAKVWVQKLDVPDTRYDRPTNEQEKDSQS
jgi:molecular chaperone GrpE (heat shock protein)